MIPPRTLARMISDRGRTPEAAARAVIEAVLLRDTFDRIDDKLTAIELHSEAFEDDGHELLVRIVADLRRRISCELERVDLALSETDRKDDE